MRNGSWSVSVQRVGTQVVVRLAGRLDDSAAERLTAAVSEVEAVVLRRVVVDLDEVSELDGAGLDFLAGLHERWQVRLVNTPSQLRGRLPARSRPATDEPLAPWRPG